MGKKEENAKNPEVQNPEAEELSMDDLDQVSGGAGLRNVKKVKTTEISSDTIRKI